MIRSVLFTLLTLASGSAVAAPIPKHLFPKESDVLVPGLVFSWPNTNLWVVLDVPPGDSRVQVQLADGTGKTYWCSADEVRQAWKNHSRSK